MARNRTTKDRLTELYPTQETMLTAREKYSSWAQMAEAIGISKQSIYDYREFLGMQMEVGGKKSNSFCLANKKETDDLIKKLMSGKSTNIVKVYEIESPLFYLNPREYDHLRYVRTEQGTSWAALRHQVSAIGGRGQ